jgi:hypothetical protein
MGYDIYHEKLIQEWENMVQVVEMICRLASGRANSPLTPS